MKPFTNNVILLLFKNGTKKCWTTPTGENFRDSYFKILKLEQIDKADIERWYAFEKTLYTPEQYEKHWDTKSGKMDEKTIIIDSKIDDFRQQRSRLMPILDQEFMKSLEEDCQECKDHVVAIKNYLRDVPEILIEHFKKINNIDTISSFNPYNNIFDLSIKEAGSGYEKAPIVRVGRPNGTYPGLPMRAVATLTEEGSVGEIIVTQIGSGYREEPKIKVSRPEDPSGKKAEFVASPPENDILENISWKETRVHDGVYEKNIKKLLNTEE